MPKTKKRKKARQGAELLAVSTCSVMRWIRRGELRASSVSDNPLSKKTRYRITRHAVDEFLENRGKQSLPKRKRKPRTKVTEDVWEFI